MAELTEVTYNGVVLHNVITREWDETVVYDTSDTDPTSHKFSMRFEGTATGRIAEPTYISHPTQSNQADSNPTQDVRTIKQLLKESRKSLKVTVGDQTLLEVEPMIGGSVSGSAIRDVANGPHPRHVTVSIVGARCYRVSFSIDVTIVDCKDVAAAPAVLNNRWSITEIMDGNGYMTRTIRGTMHLSTNGTAYNWKHLCVPPLEAGFKREGIEYGVSENGLSVAYSVTDHQVHTAAPWPAASFTAVYQLEGEYGLVWNASMQVRMVGRPDSDKRLLMARALQVIDARLKWVEKAEAQQFVPTTITLIEHIGPDNIVEAFVKGVATWITNVAEATTNADTSTFGVPLELEPVEGEPYPYDPSISTPYAIHGYNPGSNDARGPAVALLLSCYLQSPCSGPHGMIRGSETPPGQDGGDEETNDAEPPYVRENSYGTLSTGAGEALNDAHREAIYVMSRATSTYRTRKLRAQLPIANAQGTDGEDTCVVIELGRGVAQRVIKVSNERMGKWPEIPEKADTYTDENGIVATLLDHTITPFSPTTSANAAIETIVYRIDAEYVYALSRPPTAGEKLRVGLLAFMAESTPGNVDGDDIYNASLGP